MNRVKRQERGEGMLTRRTLLLAGALAASGCTGRSSTVRVGVLPISESLPLYVGLQSGAFEREGLAVEPVMLDGGARILEAMTSGDLAFGVSNYVSLMLAREAGLDFKLVSGATAETSDNPQHAMLVRADSTLTPQQLSGKRIAVNTRRNINELYVSAWLTSVGVDPSSVALVEVPFPRMLTALQSNSVDAAGAIEPFVTFGLRENLVRAIGRHVVDVENNVPITGWMTTGNYAQRNGDVVNRFRRALQQAAADVGADEERARAALTTFTSLSATDAAAVPLPTFNTATPPEQFGSLLERVRRAGWISEGATDPANYLLR